MGVLEMLQRFGGTSLGWTVALVLGVTVGGVPGRRLSILAKMLACMCCVGAWMVTVALDATVRGPDAIIHAALSAGVLLIGIALSVGALLLYRFARSRAGAQGGA